DVDQADRRFVFQGVHMTLDGRPGKPWRPGEQRRSELVFIGRNLDEDELRQGFQSCLVPVYADVT
ncbi:MAG: GTP-binding protein, partial [Cyanobacteria bacterium P01_H01_bin.152]